MTLGQLAAALGGELSGPAELALRGPGGYDEGQPDEIVVAFDAAAAALAEQTAAGAVIVPIGVRVDKPSIAVADPRQALLMLIAAFAPQPPAAEGVHPSAVIDPSATLADDLTIGPYAVIGADVVLGRGCRIGAHSVIAEGCRLGAGVMLYPRVTLYAACELGDRVIVHSGTVIGSDGYGYFPMDGVHHKIPQLGRVVIGDDVEIGANTCIDRATVGATRIGAGTKIDNLVQLAHNLKVGEHCLIMSQVGIAGSCQVGHHAVLAGQVGLRDHLTVGPEAKIGAKSGVMRDVLPGQVVAGAPAQPQHEWFRQLAFMRRVGEFSKRLKAIERRLDPPASEDQDLAP